MFDFEAQVLIGWLANTLASQSEGVPQKTPRRVKLVKKTSKNVKTKISPATQNSEVVPLLLKRTALKAMLFFCFEPHL